MVRKIVMSSELLELAQKLVAQLSSLDADGGLEKILHEDAILVTPGSTFAASKKSRAEILDYFKNKVFPRFKKVIFTPSNIFLDPEKSVAIIEWDSELEPMNGNTYKNNGVWVVHIENGAVHMIKEYFDTEKVTQNVK